jgi:hypothetical protein
MGKILKNIPELALIFTKLLTFTISFKDYTILNIIRDIIAMLNLDIKALYLLYNN